MSNMRVFRFLISPEISIDVTAQTLSIALDHLDILFGCEWCRIHIEENDYLQIRVLLLDFAD